MGFDLYESMLLTKPLAEVMRLAAGRMQSEAVDAYEAYAISSAPTEPVPYSPYESGTDSIPITYAESA